MHISWPLKTQPEFQIDRLRGVEVRSENLDHSGTFHAFSCKHSDSVLGFPNTLCSGWRSFQLPEKLCAHFGCTGMDLRQTFFLRTIERKSVSTERQSLKCALFPSGHC